MFDYLIKNATLVDGLGGAPKAGDLAIKDGVIAEIGAISGQAKETINAEGAYAAPGWVDVHTHYDCLLYTSPSPRDRQKSRMPSSA